MIQQHITILIDLTDLTQFTMETGNRLGEHNSTKDRKNSRHWYKIRKCHRFLTQDSRKVRQG